MNNFSILDMLNSNSSVLGMLNQNFENFNVLNSGISYYALCFDESTDILCLCNNLEEKYISIKDISKGSIIKTFKHGYRRVLFIHKGTFINDIKNIRNCMFLMRKNETMTKDLILTGYHSILVDSMTLEEKRKNNKISPVISNTTIDGKKLLMSCASSKFIALDNKNEYNYYHIVLENDGDDDARYGLWANGVLCETPSKNDFLKEIEKENEKKN
jgi:hypothetical protein